jgi:hypothetical protein
MMEPIVTLVDYLFDLAYLTWFQHDLDAIGAG